MRYIEKLDSNSLVKEAQELLNGSRHYNDSDRVKDIIRMLYYGCCAFCGSSPEHSSFYQIEHFYPKGNAKYNQYEKNILNLHYSCQRCNTLKGKDVNHSIFSPNNYLIDDKWHHTSRYKIDSELIYIGHILYSLYNQPGSIDRAKATIELFDLNNDNSAIRSSRQHLIEERIRVFNSVYELLLTIYSLLNEDTSSPYIDRAIRQLFMMVIRYVSPQSPFSNMIVHNFGDDIIKLLEVYVIKKQIHQP